MSSLARFSSIFDTEHNSRYKFVRKSFSFLFRCFVISKHERQMRKICALDKRYSYFPQWSHKLKEYLFSFKRLFIVVNSEKYLNRRRSYRFWWGKTYFRNLHSIRFSRFCCRPERGRRFWAEGKIITCTIKPRLTVYFHCINLLSSFWGFLEWIFTIREEISVVIFFLFRPRLLD